MLADEPTLLAMLTVCWDEGSCSMLFMQWINPKMRAASNLIGSPSSGVRGFEFREQAAAPDCQTSLTFSAGAECIYTLTVQHTTGCFRKT